MVVRSLNVKKVRTTYKYHIRRSGIAYCTRLGDIVLTTKNYIETHQQWWTPSNYDDKSNKF